MNTPNVAAALIINEAGEVLCTLRGASKHASVAHKWEFPGGKIEPGETAEQAAVREVQEELGLEIEPLGTGCTVEHAYPEFTVRLNGVLCAAKGSTWTLREHLDARWVAPDRLEELDFAAADTAILLWLKERFFGSCLRTERFGRYPTFLAECSSTNDEALRLAEAGAPEGTLVVANVQRAGRGRLGRTWLSEPGQGLLFSLVARPQLPPEVAATLPLVAGLAVTAALREAGAPEAGLKWPNDVLLGERKVCGILCEAQTSARGIEGIIVGIGVNTGAVPESLAHRAIALGSGAQRPDRLRLLARICAHFEALYGRWLTGGLAALRAELDAADCKRGNPITVKPGREVLTGIARGIREDGALLLETASGTEAILCGEIVQWHD